ncbi:ribosome maturation factor RimP [Salinisphaera sp. Q1T1-3]|uniref:ribosome maturation factor RimP n=1 Tax=Salinisphaera sp. Q1T1-3 TaxID=2321229 RepID=UPI000E753B5E|nr:ribosome maturation factor RimP [Salinisphaera sp. Q1T1-3]RJS92714.1 ribosome maturation factor RimP [Salinisphaera sp. Q1T1-3]
MTQRFHSLIEPIVTDLGYELWHVESVGRGKNATLRVYIDASEGIDIEDCEAVSREVSAALDVADDGSAAYTLEVSSPGLDRPLVDAGHFEQFIGERARVNMFAPVAGQRKFRGVIRAVSQDAVDLACDDAIYSLPIGDMAKARLDPVFET